ncbi:MAG: molybdopterin-dependent oxidoreductase [Deltaproteobacteria bacterium]|nr:molybdopterin-dependent oxidoreductase [Deltaproteobacteria bacterium]
METGARTVRCVCPHDCPDACSMLVTVEQGRATRLVGDPDHRFTAGFLCVKVSRYLERVYSPARLLHPLRRVGPKGAGRFERISWDEALDAIAQRFREIAASPDGPQAILPYSYGGTMGLLQGGSMDRRFFHRLGASVLDRTICSTAGGEGYRRTIGTGLGFDPEAIEQARLIVLWGNNLLTSNVHLWPFVQRARKQGALLVCVDPLRHRTAEHADRHLQLLPGTDAALALGMMQVILAEGLEDREYIARYTTGFEALRERVKAFPPDRVAALTGLAGEEVVWLARAYATTQPAAIRINYGMARHGGGGMAVRTVACLPALVGAWRHPGGGILLGTSAAFPVDLNRLQRPDLIPSGTRTLNMSLVGELLTAPDLRPPVRALYVYNSNPAAMAPHQEKVLRGLRREDLFTVVHDQFVTDTADYADIVLPATTQLEHFDLMKSWGTLYLQVNDPAIAPLGEARPNTEVFRLLAARLGFTEPCFQDSDEEMARQALASGHPWLAGITLEALRARGPLRLNLPEPFSPFAEGRVLLGGDGPRRVRPGPGIHPAPGEPDCGPGPGGPLPAAPPVAWGPRPAQVQFLPPPSPAAPGRGAVGGTASGGCGGPRAPRGPGGAGLQRPGQFPGAPAGRPTGPPGRGPDDRDPLEQAEPGGDQREQHHLGCPHRYGRGPHVPRQPRGGRAGVAGRRPAGRMSDEGATGSWITGPGAGGRGGRHRGVPGPEGPPGRARAALPCLGCPR